MAGVAAAVTVGCALTVLDTPPRLLVMGLARDEGSAAAGTLLWLFLVLLWWLGLGAALGALLPMLGRFGRQLQAIVAAPLAGVLSAAGLSRAAAWLSGAEPAGKPGRQSAGRAWRGAVVAAGGVTRTG
jgi:hypothetical protein